MYAKFINESYESYNELKFITEEIYKKYSKSKLYSDLFSSFNYGNHYNIKKFIKNIERYKELKDFLNAGVGIILFKDSPEFQKLAGGQVIFPKDYRKAFSFVNKTRNDGYEYLEENYKVGIISLYQLSKRVIIHELQHLYDSYRSNNLAFKTKNKEKLNARINNTKEGEDWMSDETTRSIYHKVPTEVNAYFTNVVNSINFFNIFGKIRPFKDVYKDFVIEFIMHNNGYQYLNKNIKKSLEKKLYVYWDKIKENPKYYKKLKS